MRYRVAVQGTDVVYERGRGRSKPRLLDEGGAELPRDRWGNYQLPSGRAVIVGYDWLQLAPVLEVGPERVLLARPVAKRVVVGLAVLTGLAFLFGGAVGTLLALATSAVVVRLLRAPNRGRAHLVGAVLTPIVAIALYVGLGVLVAESGLTG